MAPRVRVLLLAVTVLVLAPVAVLGMVTADNAAVGSTSLAAAHQPAVDHVAVPVRTPLPLVPKGIQAQAVIVTIGALAWFSIRRRSLWGLPFRLGDVGDRWRALLFGAPPSFL